MEGVWMLRLLALLVLVVPTLKGAAVSETVGAEATIRVALSAMQDAANAHDTDRFMNWYLHDNSLVITFDGDTMRGWQAIRDQQLAWWDNGKSKAVYREEQRPEITMQGSDIATTVQWLEVSGPTVDNKAKPARLVVTSVWKQRPEGWRIVLAHESLRID
jgi:uncharacterized protein (TIGR02246 family)